MEREASEKIKTMTRVALMTAVLCVLSPLSIPIGPVPMSLAVLAVLLCAYVLPPLQAGLASLVYMVLGVAGLPVFAGFTSGPARLLGPTGGYIVGFVFLALISSCAVKLSYRMPHREAKNRAVFGLRGAAIQIVGMLLGLLVLYAFGTAWFVISKNVPALSGDEASGITIAVALAKCVTPFVAIDLLKIAIGFVTGNAVRMALSRAGLVARCSN